MCDELIKRLRSSAQWYVYGMLIDPSVCLEAANAWPRWIPITEQLPEEAGKQINTKEDRS